MSIEDVTQYSIEKFEYNVKLANLLPAERRDACQIPASTLKQMTTQAVIQAVLDHPMQMDILLHNEFMNGLNYVYKDNNALSELTKRDDKGALFLERLKSINPVVPNGLKDVVLEYLFSNYLENPDDMKIVVAISINYYNLRHKENTFLFGGFESVPLLLISKAMLVANYTPFENYVKENQSMRSFFDYFAGKGGFMTDILFSSEKPLTQTILDFAIKFNNEK
jgi:hypothetical protein